MIDRKQRGARRPSLWSIGAAFGIALLTIPGIARAGGVHGAVGIEVLLASATNLTDGEMAAQTGGGLQLATPVPNLQPLHPKVRLWDELVPTLSQSAANQSVTVTVRTGP